VFVTDRLTPTHATEQLDHRDLLAASRGPGCYALRLAVPDSTEAARERWDAHHDARPPEPTLERLAAAEQVAYIGAAREVYGRIMDHAAGDVRKAAICEAFPPVDIMDVWPTDDPFAREWDRARKVAENNPGRVWVNGELL
jgi:hypothetical protein